MKFIEIKLKEIIPDPESEGCFRLILEDSEEGLEVPMVISSLNAGPLLTELSGTQSIRPNTHELFSQFIASTDYRLRQVNILDFRRGVFYASLVFGRADNQTFEMDCRPTDGIALAILNQVPMYMSEEVMQRMGVLLSHDMGRMKLPQRLQVMEEKLRRLVVEERYEEAGILRDRILSLKENGD